MKFTKSIISFILTLSIVVSMAAFLTVGSNAADNSLGDANSDAAINSFDALPDIEAFQEVQHAQGR